MKKLSLMFLLLVAGLYFTACGDDSDVPANGYIETTEEGSATFVLKGYEDASDGFNVFEGEGFEKSFYILEKKFTGSAWNFVKAASIIRKSKFPPNPERSVQFSGKRTKRSVQKIGCTQHL